MMFLVIGLNKPKADSFVTVKIDFFFDVPKLIEISLKKFKIKHRVVTSKKINLKLKNLKSKAGTLPFMGNNFFTIFLQ